MQYFQKVKQEIETGWLEKKKKLKTNSNLKLSWSNWCFGQETLENSLLRLRKNGIEYVELHGNRYGEDLGYKSADVKSLISKMGMKVSGVCGMFSADNDLSSPVGSVRQRAIDYIKRNVELAYECGGQYFLLVPGAVGRAQAYDNYEFDRSVESLQLVADVFVQADIACAIEPIRSAEVSFCHTLEDAMKYIEAVNHPGVRFINADIYHMFSEESNPYAAIVQYGEYIINLHLADTNRRALGEGCLDVDLLIKALYLSDFSERGYCTAEPLGPGGDPYPAMFGRPNPDTMDQLVQKTAETFFSREKVVKEL